VSSAILYAAIVAIWIGVLVPRWLRYDHARDGHLRLRRFSSRRDSQAHAGDASGRPGLSQDGRPRYTSFGGSGAVQAGPEDALAGSPGAGAASAYVSAPVSGNIDSMAQLSEAEAEPVRPYGWSAEEYLRHERSGQRDPQPERGPAGHSGCAEHDGAHGERLHYGERAGRDERPPSSERPRHDAHRQHERPQRPERPDDGEQAVPLSGERPGMADSDRRTRVIQGRRRMLWMLLVLTAIAAGLASLGLAAWWIVVPPVVVLLGYLLLLREAAQADAEARERAATMARRAREAEARREREATAQRDADAQREQARRAAQAGTPPGGSAPVWAANETLSHAEIIDISERVGDQLYDQYADAKLRAVGD
jgi:hypothetical protein